MSGGLEARHLLKALKDDGWYLGDTAGASRQYVHPERQEIVTVCVRYTDGMGPATRASALEPALVPPLDEPNIIIESADGAVSAYSPDLPGCIATGSDEADARARMAEAVALHRKGLKGR